MSRNPGVRLSLLVSVLALLLGIGAAQVSFQRTYASGERASGHCALPTPDNGYIIAGQAVPSGPTLVWLIKTDSLGDTLWTRTYGGWYGECAYSVDRTLDGGYIVCGCTRSFGAGGQDVWLLKTDAQGDTQWTRTFGGAYEDLGYSVAPTADAGFVVAGYKGTTSSGGAVLYLIKTDRDGLVGIAERPMAAARRPPAATIVRGVLVLDAAGGRQHSACRAELLDISGREVLALQPGANDVRELAPGVYFLRGPGRTDRRVVLTR